MEYLADELQHDPTKMTAWTKDELMFGRISAQDPLCRLLCCCVFRFVYRVFSQLDCRNADVMALLEAEVKFQSSAYSNVLPSP